MCNDYGNYVDYADYLAAFSQTRIPVKWPDAIPNLQPRDDIWPTDRAPVIRRLEDGVNEGKRPSSHILRTQCPAAAESGGFFVRSR